MIGLTNYKHQGVNGIEFALEEILKPVNGFQEKTISRKQGVIDNKILKKPINGSPVKLTVDARLQFVLFDKCENFLPLHQQAFYITR